MVNLEVVDDLENEGVEKKLRVRCEGLVDSKVRLLLAPSPSPTLPHPSPPPAQTDQRNSHASDDNDSEQPTTASPSVFHRRGRPEVTRPVSEGR